MVSTGAGSWRAPGDDPLAVIVAVVVMWGRADGGAERVHGQTQARAKGGGSLSPTPSTPWRAEHRAPTSHLPSTCSPFWSPADNGHQVPLLYPPPPRPNTHTYTRPPYRAGRELRLFLHVARRDSHRQPCWPDARGKGVCSRNPSVPTQAGTPTVRDWQSRKHPG